MYTKYHNQGEEEIRKLLSMWAIAKILTKGMNEFVCVIPTTTIGRLQVNLILTHLNKFLQNKQFKMESFQTALNLLLPCISQAICDFTHGYYTRAAAKQFMNKNDCILVGESVVFLYYGSKWALLYPLHTYQTAETNMCRS